MNNSTVPSGTSLPTQPSCSLDSPNTATKIALTTVYVVIAIVAFLGNCAIIIIAKTKKRLRKVAFNFFIISMATADILDALISVPMQVLYFHVGERWFGGLIGNITCKVSIFLDALSLAASVLTLMAISVDRYLAIVHVLREPMSKKKVKLVLVSLWLFAATLQSPFLVKYKVHAIEENHHCFGSWSDQRETNLKIYRYEVAIRFVFLYIIPLVLMTVLYSSIIRVLKKRQAFGENMSQLRIQAQNVTVIKMVVSVVLLFAFCWLPAHIVTLMIAFAYQKLTCMPISLLLSLLALAHANGAINPCIYLIFNENFRKGLKQLFVNCRKKPTLGLGTTRSKQWPGSSTLERDPSRGGIRGFFRDLSKISRGKFTDSDDITYETRF